MMALTDDGLSADVRAAYDWLKGEGVDKVATIGYCMGGRSSYLASLGLPLAAAASYYGGGIAPNERSSGLLHRTAEVQAPLLLVWGGKDAHIGQGAIRSIEDSLIENGKTYVNVVMSDADHGFFCDARASYSPTAAAQIWPFTLAFLAEHTKG